MVKYLIIVIILFSFPSYATELSIHFVCAEWEGYTNEDGTGVYWEIVKAVYEPLGYKIHTNVFPWKRAEYMVETKKTDALVGDYYYPNKDGKERLYPVWHISIEEPLVAIFIKGDHKIKDFNSLKNKSIVWLRGYDFDSIYLKDIPHTMLETDSIKKGLKLISLDCCDVFLDYISNIENAAKKININPAFFETVVVKKGNKLFLNFLNTEKSKEFIKIYDKRIPELLKSGELEEIFKKYNLTIQKFGPDQ